MESVLIRQPRLYIVLRFSILAVCILILFTACDPKAGKYPYSEDSEWICTDPYFVLSYSRISQGGFVEIEYLEWEDTTIAVDVKYQSSGFWVYPKGSNVYDERLLSGTWKYRKGNLVFFIDEDFVFNNQFSELVFTPVQE